MPTNETIQRTLSLIVAPVVMITACALLLGVYYSRLTAKIHRARTVDKKITDFIEYKLRNQEQSILDDQNNRNFRFLKNECEALLTSAKKNQTSIYTLEGSILLMILTSFFAALTLVLETVFIPLTLLMIVIGMSSMFAAICVSFSETRECLNGMGHEFNEQSNEAYDLLMEN
jgi:Flp pilus assembly protein TadB